MDRVAVIDMIERESLLLTTDGRLVHVKKCSSRLMPVFRDPLLQAVWTQVVAGGALIKTNTSSPVAAVQVWRD